MSIEKKVLYSANIESAKRRVDAIKMKRRRSRIKKQFER